MADKLVYDPNRMEMVHVRDYAYVENGAFTGVAEPAPEPGPPIPMWERIELPLAGEQKGIDPFTPGEIAVGPDPLAGAVTTLNYEGKVVRILVPAEHWPRVANQLPAAIRGILSSRR